MGKNKLKSLCCRYNLCNIVFRHTSNLAFCGGVTSGLRPHIYNNRITKQHFMSIGFIESGESSCKAYSIVIPDELDFEAQIVKVENYTLYNNKNIIRVCF